MLFGGQHRTKFFRVYILHSFSLNSVVVNVKLMGFCPTNFMLELCSNNLILPLIQDSMYQNIYKLIKCWNYFRSTKTPQINIFRHVETHSYVSYHFGYIQVRVTGCAGILDKCMCFSSTDDNWIYSSNR